MLLKLASLTRSPLFPTTMGHPALSDQACLSPYILRGAYYSKDRDDQIKPAFPPCIQHGAYYPKDRDDQIKAAFPHTYSMVLTTRKTGTIRSSLPFPIHTAWCLLLKRQRRSDQAYLSPYIQHGAYYSKDRDDQIKPAFPHTYSMVLTTRKTETPSQRYGSGQPHQD